MSHTLTPAQLERIASVAVESDGTRGLAAYRAGATLGHLEPGPTGAVWLVRSREDAKSAPAPSREAALLYLVARADERAAREARMREFEPAVKRMRDPFQDPVPVNAYELGGRKRPVMPLCAVA